MSTRDAITFTIRVISSTEAAATLRITAKIGEVDIHQEMFTILVGDEVTLSPTGGGVTVWLVRREISR